MRAGQELNPRAWEAIKRHHLDGGSVEDIAQQIQQTVPNVKVLLFRGRGELRELLRWESCSVVRPADLKDWPQFCAQVCTQSRHKRASVAGCLWSAFDNRVQECLQRVVTTGMTPAPDAAATVISCLNSLLRQDGLWPAALLTDLRRQLTFPEEAARLVRRRRLGPISTLRLNRLILEFGLPGIIAVSDPGATDYER
jgi:hypothetical protein